MDYKTKPTSREKLRLLAELLRQIFGLNKFKPIPVLMMLEQLPDVLKGTNYIVVNDWELPENIPARCYLDDFNNFTIEIKKYVYEGAYNNVGCAEGLFVTKFATCFSIK